MHAHMISRTYAYTQRGRQVCWHADTNVCETKHDLFALRKHDCDSEDALINIMLPVVLFCCYLQTLITNCLRPHCPFQERPLHEAQISN